uniref:Membrane protein n=1 Tax=Mycena chlorophos TaxID=658473 RepID=A0ABQ0LF73_MYCCL|nr:membrane protein [Mycena chlorophos]
MALPDISALSLEDPGGPSTSDAAVSQRYLAKYKQYLASLPYTVEPDSKLLAMLDFIVLRLMQCVAAKDYEVGFLQWDTILQYWCTLKRDLPRETRVKLAKVYFHLSVMPGMPTSVMAAAADGFKSLASSTKKITIKDMRLPWRPIFDVLSKEMFLTRRQFEYTQIPWVFVYVAANSRRFFHPAAINDMLSVFLPLHNATDLDYVLAAQVYMLNFLPISHPQSYLPMLFRVWESVNSYQYDERMLDFLASIAEMHVAADISDPRHIAELPDDAQSEGETRPKWSQDDLPCGPHWPGIYKDVGVFTDHEFSLLMFKCLASFEIPLADGGSLSTGHSADRFVAAEIGRLPKPEWRIDSLARIIVYSMAPDGIPTPPSTAPTPLFTPPASGMTTPRIPTSTSLQDYLSAPLARRNGTTSSKHTTYLAGSKALEALSHVIASLENFFHPSNSGNFTVDLAAFIKSIAYEFNKRWMEEQEPACKTPRSRRLTRQMRRELVKTLRTVAFLAIFSEDSNVVGNIQSCLKSMSVMEPDLIVHPILERAVPALETLVETQRTIAVIKALGAIAPAIVSRKVYFPGAKHLVPLLQLLIPAIDLNDPNKTLHTTQFLVEISQCVMFADSTPEPQDSESTSRTTSVPKTLIPSFTLGDYDDGDREFPRLSNAQEDALLQDTTASFADWIAQFIRRVYQLQENLPEEGGGSSEVDTVDAVGRACLTIVAHLSEPLYQLVLNMVYDYVSTNVRANAVRGIHLLIEALANANPSKCMDKFFPLCESHIKIELENGASSLRTTAASTPLPSDATLHWYLAILRGCAYTDGNAILPYRQRLVDLLKLLHTHCYANRGFTWSSKLLGDVLRTLAATYPLDNRFVNPDEWNSPEFRDTHYRHWGRVYKAEDVKISWHVPNADEVDYTLQIFEEIVEPTLTILEKLLDPANARNAVWSNDFCRHIAFVTNAFAGVPTLCRDEFDENALRKAMQGSDILHEIDEMIGIIEPLEAGFVLTDRADPRYQYMNSLRRRFGKFLHDASRALVQQGEENTVDATEMLLEGIRTFLCDYGSDGGYSSAEKKYNAEKNIARHFAKQREWPRSVWVRRARYYHSARLHWNSVERLRGPLEDLLIDDLVEWSLCSYATIRSYGQTVLENLCNVYDGVRRRTLPTLYKALEPGTDDDRMKGALWTLNLVSFGKYAASELLLAPKLIQSLFGSQHNEKPSIQDAVSTVSENCLNSLPEPCFLVYDLPTPELDVIFVAERFNPEQVQLIRKCEAKRRERVQLMDDCSNQLMETILAVGNSKSTHWKYEIGAISNPNLRYYAQRAAMKSLRNMKIKTFSKNAKDPLLGRNHNPLHTHVHVTPTHEFTRRILNAFIVPPDLSDANLRFLDKDPMPGWLTWPLTVPLYKPPDAKRSTFLPWSSENAAAIQAMREIVVEKTFWEQLSTFYSEENDETTINLDNVSYIKSIFQVLEDEPFSAVEPTLASLLSNKEPDKQRALAELLAGIIGGSKHWSLSKQSVLWDWFKPVMAQIFSQNLKTDTVNIWESFLGYLFHNKDPRRLQPLVDHIMKLWTTIDFQPELTFDATKILSIFKAFYQELNWKFTPWLDNVVEQCWNQLQVNEHEEVRNHISELLLFASIIKTRPTPSQPTTEIFLRECRVLPVDHDIMGMRGYYHGPRIAELVQKFHVWREERVPGVRAFQSTYDRMGVTICKFLFQHLLEPTAIATFDYIVPLMPELFRFTEVNDNDDLATRGNDVLVQMCGVRPPHQLVNSVIDGIFDTIQNSPSWRVRLKALPLVQVFYFRQMPLISESKVLEILEVLSKCLDDEIVDVREMAATTLSGVLRLSPRRHIYRLRDRFVQLIRKSHLPPRGDPSYARSVRQRHAAILGVCAIVESSPYTVEKWTPGLLTDVLAEHTYDPAPISTSVRKTARNFSRTHRDTWHEDSARFNEDQLAALSTLLTGSSYYA